MRGGLLVVWRLQIRVAISVLPRLRETNNTTDLGNQYWPLCHEEYFDANTLLSAVLHALARLSPVTKPGVALVVSDDGMQGLLVRVS